MKLNRLSPSDFDRIAQRTRMKPRAVEMARAVLVDGRSQAEVAVEYGMTKQRISLAVASIEKAYIQSDEPGGGMITASITMPEPLAVALADMIEALERSDDEAKRGKVLAQVLQAVRAGQKALRA